MRKTRFMSLLFVVLSIAFFFMPEFRQGLEMAGWGLVETSYVDWLDRVGKFDRRIVKQFALAAEQQRDAQTLAFLSLYYGSDEERNRYAEQAVALDPQFTWVYYDQLSYGLWRLGAEPRSDNPRLDQWIARLKAWDPENAAPYLFEGELIVLRRRDKFPSYRDLSGLEKETAWRQAMAKAFAAPRIDSYLVRRFELQRAWLRRNHLDRPGVMLALIAIYPYFPNLPGTLMYVDLLVRKLGQEAEQAGHVPEALNYYWTAAHFCERVRLQGYLPGEQSKGAIMQRTACEKLLPLLRRTARADEAAEVENALEEIRRTLFIRGQDPLDQTSNYQWATWLVHLFAGLVLAFGVLTGLTVIYVNAKRWVRLEKKGRLYQLLTMAENYAPIFLFLACLGFYLSYYPYAANFHYYMEARGELRNILAAGFNIFPSFDLIPDNSGAPLGNPFRRYGWFVLVGVGLIVIISYLFRRGAPSVGNPPAESK